MKLTTLKESLNNGLRIVEKISGKNLTLPILNNVLIVTEKNFLNLTTTDLEIGIKYRALVKTEKEGQITVPTKILSSFIGFLPEEKITLEVKNQTLYISCKNYNTQIKGQSADEFPLVPKIKNDNFLEINSAPFCEGLSQVVDFSVLNQARPELSGVYLSFQKDALQMTATDGFRLAEKTLYFEKKNNQDLSFILPQKTAREIINIFSEKTGKIKILLSPNQVLFESLEKEISRPQIQITSRLVEGEYPDYREIIPKKHKIQAVFLRSDLLGQIKAAGVFSGKSNEVKIKIDPKKEEMEMVSQNPEYGENKSLLSGKFNYKEGPQKMEISFNYRFLIDGLLNISSPKVLFELNGEDGPATLKPENDSSYVYVVMPIKSV